MIEYLSGNLAEVSPALAVIDCQGVGYAVHISLNTFGKLSSGSKTKLYVHAVYREDAQLLFGFYTQEERFVFRMLISVSGVGPNTARLILSSLSASEVVEAIQVGNVGAFSSVKGIGAKTAQRLIVDLRDKAGQGAVLGIPGEGSATMLPEALNALMVLGYAKPVAEKAVLKVMKDQPELSLENLIKQTLKIL